MIDFATTERLIKAIKSVPTPLPKVGLEPQILRAPITDCLRRGDEIGTTPCLTCTGRVDLKVYDCSIHKKCTIGKEVPGLKCCATCNDCAIYPDITTRNLIYYIYPVVGTGIWEQCVDEIAASLDLFNGKIVVCIAQEEEVRKHYGNEDAFRVPISPVAHYSQVQQRFANKRIEYLIVKNNPYLWESAHHRVMFESVLSLDPTSATLYAHAKGTTRPIHHPAHRWREVLHDTLVRNWDNVHLSLKKHPCTGSFKKLGHGFAYNQSPSSWHYSGSWWWFRNKELFSRTWLRLDRFFAAIETYPSLQFTAQEAGCVFHTASVQAMNLYDPGYWSRIVEPEYKHYLSRISSQTLVK